MDIKNKIKEYFQNLNSLGILSLVRWGILGISLICVILCECVNPSTALAIFAILLWISVIAFIVLSIIIYIKKKKAKKNKSY